MKVLFASSESAPFFKTGGLGDVTGALPKALAKKAEIDEVAVFLPYFQQMKDSFKAQLEDVCYDYVEVGWRRQYVGVKSLELDGVKYYFLDNEYYFNRDTLYGYYDDGERWAFFDLAICRLMEKLDFIPDVLHVNDFHTAMIPFLLKEKFNWIQAYDNIKTVLTIHNIEFQGSMDPTVLTDLFGMGMERYFEGVVRHNNAINFLKAGILYSDRVTTVSETYAQEIQTPEFGCGLDGVLGYVKGKLTGIVNGIDYEVFNPETDPLLTEHFSRQDLSGKVKIKQGLQKRLGLPIDPDVPLIGMVSRLTTQKGFDLVLAEMDHFLSAGNVQIVLLGTGYKDLEEGFRYYAGKYEASFKAVIDFDLQLAQEIYAASDFFLMPSAFEPCGLSQMIAMRYGSLPIVHEIGGLKDTVKPYNPIYKEGTGFGFVRFDASVLRDTVMRALQLFEKEAETIKKMQASAMSEDFSWTSKSQAYLELYKAIL
ncbi:glycogen synthase GlgA [Lactococcus termiticola]|uniref:Glycogen synthase n=1 Tax=Lactococcus termiticola TaxID=2169526 RepID=A0A2R5HK11_9LACT|nr:glycogen synthase GlgA [Lactococcus termiticola]GBG96771.1 glycogen synthase [Lactococcus termiticola]